ncbi:iron-enterobactin ABC transporter permease [Mycolicibacterium obuense]|uniref:Ferric enterobactin transport system permease protein FepG n=1 Tax=Mycolicibacterium obuense TaxID=1807 RepID=A0A0J6VTN3_9MYCO|nr:iron chelate uptake ABC transporter family permease subunit [Mycolicibacterium obuense]KMO73534.1 Ferric enterobactin transport system permease protein FepG [Mycolicibacterium obuense]OKH73920.1 iron ABC transporter permease [Mycobacterium sp. SWH-M1]TDL07545.1 iron-enterobactin ABC transporter permease [Mycolicibacterium obuense]
MTATTSPVRRRRHVLRVGGIAVRTSRRAVVVVAVLLAGMLLTALLAVGLGKYHVAPLDVVSVLTGSNTSFDRVVVLEWRLPRMLMALLVGAALGLSGAIFQAITGNPLGSPEIVGVNFGAYTGALAVLATLGSGYYAVAAGALLGGLVTAVVVYALSFHRGVAGYRLIVVGIAVGAVLNSVNQWIVIKLDHHTAVTAAVWQQGTLSGLTWTQVIPMTVCVALLVSALVALGPQLPVLQLGDDAAGALGVRPDRARAAYLVVGVGLVAVACAAAGPITFVALAAPQLARRLTASPGVALLPAAVMGAALLLVSDVIAQQLFSDNELPVGVVTVSLGGCYLIYLLATQARKR